MKPRIALRAPESDPPATGNGPDTSTDAVTGETAPDNADTDSGDAPEGETDQGTTDTASDDAPEGETPAGDAPEGTPGLFPIQIAQGKNAQPGDTITMNDITFTFVETLNPSNLFEVQIGATGPETIDNLNAAIRAAANAGPQPGSPAVAMVAPATPDEATMQADDDAFSKATAAERFDMQYPAFGGWFDRVQKWAQFNSRPIPEPNPEWQACFAAKQLPHEAAAAGCLPQT